MGSPRNARFWAIIRRNQDLSERRHWDQGSSPHLKTGSQSALSPGYHCRVAELRDRCDRLYAEESCWRIYPIRALIARRLLQTSRSNRAALTQINASQHDGVLFVLRRQR
jgi:hypothetical protein